MYTTELVVMEPEDPQASPQMIRKQWTEKDLEEAVMT
jgi:hypothetical protein